MIGHCHACGCEYDIAPTEPPVGTWVRDRFGGTHYRRPDGWACAPTGFYAFGVWSAMWAARGPLIECGPYGLPMEADA